ncbi:RNA-binding motif protein, X-linked 2 [Macrosteles quadrilineatus]|uniref:RNA-binding motif protein, X-linked 2 n=1 Tax=Macrosteles quadrilineatus TaxID=74068 RepID=UPI0023E134F5|nr:RNA-binding motif protein, X-linked 2 [Macrosteles quadrilineatus]
MNPLTNVKNIKKLSEQELKSGNTVSSWHNQYKDSAWIFIGGLPYDLTEGDVLCIFSECGEIVNINLVRDKGTGKQKGFCFLCYEDQRSTILAVDNLNGIKVCGRTIRVDHVADYKPPKESSKAEKQLTQLQLEGCAPVPVTQQVKTEKTDADIKKEKKRKKKEKKEKKKRRKKEKKNKKVEKEKEDSDTQSSSDDSESD